MFTLYRLMFAACCNNKPSNNSAMKNIHQTHQNSGDYHARLTTNPKQLEAGKSVLLTLEVKKNNEIVPLDITHEKNLHLMIVSEHLDWFRHVHPKEQTNGSFVIEETFPNGGKYLLFVDYKPKGGEPVLDKLKLNVGGTASDEKQILSEKLVSEVDEFRVMLENGNNFKTNRTQALKLSIEKNGVNVLGSDLEQYLGANAHIVMVGKSDKEYMHIHPVKNHDFPIYAETLIEKPGIYRVWVQFQTNKKVHTADFTVNVEQGNEVQHKNTHSHHRH